MENKEKSIEKLLEDSNLQDRFGPLEAGGYDRGVYTFPYYTLRLSPDVKDVLRRNHTGDNRDLLTFGEVVNAGSTALHENIHWWQYVGSTSGLIFSLSYPALAHCNLECFKEFLELSGKYKPIIAYAESHEYEITESEIPIINSLLNSYVSISNYCSIMKDQEKRGELKTKKGFISVADTVTTVYFYHLSLLEMTFDYDNEFIPNTDLFNAKINKLLTIQNEKADKAGDGLADLPNLSLVDLYEGQTRFNQMIYMKGFSIGNSCDWDFFDRANMLHGVYYNSFKLFLDIVNDGKRPESIDSPLVALYLLLLDIAINPAEGFIYEIVNPESFTSDINPTVRFVNLCKVIKEKFLHFKDEIKDCSEKEYWEVSTALCDELGYISPKKYLTEIERWCQNNEGLKKLLKENEEFVYSSTNLAVRLIFGRFLSFQLDKLRNPEVFCWPGVHVNTAPEKKYALDLYLKHQAIFTENDDNEITPSVLPGIKYSDMVDTASSFYQSVTVYDLCKQWVWIGGNFKCDASWLSNNSEKKVIEDWVKFNFEQVFNVPLEGFITVPFNKK